MLVTLLGIVTEVRREQYWNAKFPMLVTLLGIVTEVRPRQTENAPSPMLVTLQVTPSYTTVSGITMSPLYLTSFLYLMTLATLAFATISYQSPSISTSSTAKALAAADSSITIKKKYFFIISYRFFFSLLGFICKGTKNL